MIFNSLFVLLCTEIHHSKKPVCSVYKHMLRVNPIFFTFITRCIFLCSIDGRHNDRMGRYINDVPKKLANCIVKSAFLCGKARVLIFAGEQIKKGVELRYDYGVKDLPWRKVILTSLLLDCVIIVNWTL